MICGGQGTLEKVPTYPEAFACSGRSEAREEIPAVE
jgi:hypothetical protein